MLGPQLVSCYDVGSSSRNQLHLSFFIFSTWLSKASKACCRHHLFGSERNTPQSSVPEEKPQLKKDSWFHKANIFSVCFCLFLVSPRPQTFCAKYRLIASVLPRKGGSRKVVHVFFSVPFHPLLSSYFFCRINFLAPLRSSGLSNELLNEYWCNGRSFWSGWMLFNSLKEKVTFQPSNRKMIILPWKRGTFMKSYGGGQLPPIKTGREPGRVPDRIGSTLFYPFLWCLPWNGARMAKHLLLAFFFLEFSNFPLNFSSDPPATLSLAPLPQDNTGMTVWFVWKRHPKKNQF